MRTRAPPVHEKRKSMAIANQMYEQEDSVRDSIMYEDSNSKIDVTGIVDVTKDNQDGIVEVEKDNYDTSAIKELIVEKRLSFLKQ